MSTANANRNLTPDLPTCPVCQENITAPIYLCQSGHSICSSCKSRLQPPICPLCRRPMTGMRNWMIEELIGNMSQMATALTSRLRSAEAEKQRLCQENASLRDELEVTTALASHLQSAEAENQTFCQEIESLRSDLEMSMTLNSHLQSAETDNQTLRQENASLRDELEVTRALASHLQSEEAEQQRLCQVNASLLDERETMIDLASHLQTMEAEKQRLCQENASLCDEIKIAKQRLQALQQRVAQLEEEKRRLHYTATTRIIPILVDSDAPKENTRSTHNETNPDTSLAELFHGDDQDDDLNNASMSPTPLSQFAQEVNAGYEIPARLRTLHNLVIRYASQGRYELVEPLCKQTLIDMERTHSRDNPDFATMLIILSLIYRDQKKYKEAETLLNDALSIREKTFGQNHPTVADTLNNLAVLHEKQGNYREAESLCKRALCIREGVQGCDHPQVAEQLNQLALLCQHQEKYEQMEQYYKRALEIYESKLGPNDPKVVKIKKKLAIKQGMDKAADTSGNFRLKFLKRIYKKLKK